MLLAAELGNEVKSPLNQIFGLPFPMPRSIKLWFCILMVALL